MSPDPTDQKILVHICCAPCAEYPLRILADEGFSLHGFFYNPNIHPAEEHRRRMEGVQTLADLRELPMAYDNEILQSVWEIAEDRAVGRMCSACYALRMRRVAEFTRSVGLTYFTSTLLVSPYQQHDKIREAAECAAYEAGVRFLYRDFRPGFRMGQEMARIDGLYRQKYCGCVDSLESSRFRDRIYREHEAMRDLSAGPESSDGSHR
ncbi:MAG TPA: epoxyqueuosine reductase QueH [Clostridia bacterium]